MMPLTVSSYDFVFCSSFPASSPYSLVGVFFSPGHFLLITECMTERVHRYICMAY